MQSAYKKRIFKTALLLGTIIFCSNTGCKNQQPGKQEFLFYYRSEGGNNGYITYMDNLVITNYINKSLSIKQFVEIAKNYVDTVVADMAVSHISFLGQKPGTSLPKGGWDNYMKFKKYFIISVGFDNGFAQNANKKNKEITLINIWYNDTVITYMQPSEIDSLLKVQEPLDTGF